MRVIGQYELDDEIARGAHGTVYAACARGNPERPLAAKVAARGRAERLHHESLVLRHLGHDHVIAPVALIDDGADVALILPRASCSLTPCAGRLDGGEVAAIVSAVADGVAALHESGMAHADLRAANVLLFEDGRPVIIDLGAARPLTPEGRAGDLAAAARLGVALLRPETAPQLRLRLIQFERSPRDAGALADAVRAETTDVRWPDPSGVPVVAAEPPTIDV